METTAPRRCGTGSACLIALVMVTACTTKSESEPLTPGTTSSTSASSAAPSSSSIATVDGAAIESARRRSVVKTDEQVLLFPAYAARSADGKTWKLLLSGWIYEPEDGDYLRDEAIGKLKATLGVPEEGATAKIFEARVRPFFADNESGKAISVSVAGRVFDLPASAGDGQLSASIELEESAALAHARDGLLTAKVLLPLTDGREMSAIVRLVEPEGLTIVSDIDDTVKITEVRRHLQMLRRTFLLPFEAVPGMAAKYRAWLGTEGHLHFVSSSPWQLAAPLFDLVDTAGFPAATYSLKRVRPRDVMTTLDTLLADPQTTKPQAIRDLMSRFPQRRVVLVGDSGEQDPEVYAPIARDLPDRIVRIYIRDVTGEKRDAPRYATTFAGIPADKWVVFTETSELPSAP